MNIAIDIPTALIVSAVWLLLGLALFARRRSAATPEPPASPRIRKPKTKTVRESASPSADA